MLKSLLTFPQAFNYLFKDKVCLALSLMPIVIGIILYGFFGNFIFSEAIDLGHKYISEYFSNETMGEIVTFLVKAFLTVMLFFIVNWTFVLIVAIIASPFNDLLSERVEKIYLEETLPSFSDSVSNSLTTFFPKILNEIKKVSFILGLSILAVIIGFIPIVAPVSILISVILLASEFLDFSWGRHSLSLQECKQDLKKNVPSYMVGGIFFMVIVAIPLVNLIVPAYATSYFTLLWIKNNEHSNKIA